MHATAKALHKLLSAKYCEKSFDILFFSQFLLLSLDQSVVEFFLAMQKGDIEKVGFKNFQVAENENFGKLLFLSSKQNAG